MEKPSKLPAISLLTSLIISILVSCLVLFVYDSKKTNEMMNSKFVELQVTEEKLVEDVNSSIASCNKYSNIEGFDFSPLDSLTLLNKETGIIKQRWDKDICTYSIKDVSYSFSIVSFSGKPTECVVMRCIEKNKPSNNCITLTSTKQTVDEVYLPVFNKEHAAKIITSLQSLQNFYSSKK